MKISEVVKTNKVKSGYVWIDTYSFDGIMEDLMDIMGISKDDIIMPPFETLVFGCNKNGEVILWKCLDKKDYKTRQEAILGHEEIVKKWSKN